MLTDRGKDVSVRIVGEVFNVENHGTQVLAAAGTLRRPAARPVHRHGEGRQPTPEACAPRWPRGWSRSGSRPP